MSGKRYSFNPIHGGQFANNRDFKTTQAIASQIQNDILAKNIDSATPVNTKVLYYQSSEYDVVLESGVKYRVHTSKMPDSDREVILQTYQCL
ncbi:hypothetical protein [Nostoc punctiforme]|uniref:hypothetical protein n=1 Tax=Nostoc punctiforme TaxID=272131 RepID=UPI000300F65C|nr:hypothetical protein [Nostoc punctiforme]